MGEKYRRIPWVRTSQWRAFVDRCFAFETLALLADLLPSALQIHPRACYTADHVQSRRRTHGSLLRVPGSARDRLRPVSPDAVLVISRRDPRQRLSVISRPQQEGEKGLRRLQLPLQWVIFGDAPAQSLSLLKELGGVSRCPLFNFFVGLRTSFDRYERGAARSLSADLGLPRLSLTSQDPGSRSLSSPS